MSILKGEHPKTQQELWMVGQLLSREIIQELDYDGAIGLMILINAVVYTIIISGDREKAREVIIDLIQKADLTIGLD